MIQLHPFHNLVSQEAKKGTRKSKKKASRPRAKSKKRQSSVPAVTNPAQVRLPVGRKLPRDENQTNPY
jgi:hypothetical protein